MELNITTITYLFLRLAPFILVCFFTLASIFNQDFKGLIYLIGLIFACFITMILGQTGIFSIFNTILFGERNEVCNSFTLSQSGFTQFSNLPMSQTILGYTMFYLGTAIYNNQSFLNNLPTVIFFPLLVFFDMMWNSTNNCYSIINLVLALTIGSLVGIGWAAILIYSKANDLLYLNSISGKEECSRPTKSTFKCRVYKNGKLLGTT